ncbi:MAG: tetratricopeptide repeat protein, partial [Desulfobacterales bacterium]|nr:tetratricopeptide repeat protein [Desulfobacterales bacterium]
NDYPAAAKAYKRSLEIREKLAEDNPDTYLPDVAMTLNNLGILYRNSNDYPAAAKAYKRVLEIRERLAKSNPKVYELDLCATLGSISSLQVSLLERDPKESYKEKGLFLTQRAITILEKYKEIPKAQKYMEALVTIKTTLENISVENLKTLKAAQDFIKKGDEIIKNKGTAEDAISNYKKAIEAYEKLIAKERNTEYLLKTVDIYNTLNSIEKDAKTRIQNQEKITAIWYEIYQEQQDNEKVKQNLSQAYGYMSWYLLFDKQFKKTEQYSLKGLKLDPSQEWISINLASAYLFTGQYNKAVAIYTKLKDKPYNENKTYKDIFLEDLNELEKAGITHPDAEKVRRLLKLP